MATGSSGLTRGKGPFSLNLSETSPSITKVILKGGGVGGPVYKVEDTASRICPGF